MVHSNGMRTPVQRLSRERTGRVKYSTSCPWRRDSPSAANRAMPISLDAGSGKRGRVAIRRFAFCSLLKLVLGDSSVKVLANAERRGVAARARRSRLHLACASKGRGDDRQAATSQSWPGSGHPKCGELTAKPTL